MILQNNPSLLSSLPNGSSLTPQLLNQLQQFNKLYLNLNMLGAANNLSTLNLAQ